ERISGNGRPQPTRNSRAVPRLATFSGRALAPVGSTETQTECGSPDSPPPSRSGENRGRGRPPLPESPPWNSPGYPSRNPILRPVPRQSRLRHQPKDAAGSSALQRLLRWQPRSRSMRSQSCPCLAIRVVQGLAAGKSGLDIVPVPDILFSELPAQVDDSSLTH